MEAAEEAEVENVIIVAMLDISLVNALAMPVHLAAATTVHGRLGGDFFFLSRPFFTHSVLSSYTCDSLGHLSRDCAKCYNCLGIVSRQLFP